MELQTITIEGKRYVILPVEEFDVLQKRAGDAPDDLPALPAPDARGNYPAAEYTRALIARNVITDRRRLGWSQAELAKRSGVRVETLNRIEKCRTNADPKTIDKIESTFRNAAKPARGKRAG